MNSSNKTKSTRIQTTTGRRTFIKQASALSASAAIFSACTDGSRPELTSEGPALGMGAETEFAPRMLPSAVPGRILVVVNLDGGNDGLSTVVPAADPIYYDLRPSMAIDPDEVVALDDRLGLAPGLGPLLNTGLTTIEGVGNPNGDMSHFSMARRWEDGDPTGNALVRAGFLGRLADALDDGSPLVGLATGGLSRSLYASKASTMSLSDPGEMWHLIGDWDEIVAYQEKIAKMGEGLSTDSLIQLTGLAKAIAGFQPSERDYELPILSEGGNLGEQLYVAANFISADVGVRVIQATISGFDTHDSHRYTHDQLMHQLGAAIGGFHELAKQRGFADRVLVATTSEFGRRVEENGQGLDHGNASTMLVSGPVESVRLGEQAPLDDLDQYGNLRTTVPFERYFASLAQDWLGVEANSVLAEDAAPLGLV